MPRLPSKLEDVPAIIAENWRGYFHNTDVTKQSFDNLTFPSINCSIPSQDKIVPDKGKLLLGQAYTENNGITGNAEKYKNRSGIEMEVRVFPSEDANLKDVIAILFNQNRMLVGIITGAFQVGETIKGGTSGETAMIVSILNNVLTLENITGDFTVGETVTGQDSGATAPTITVPTMDWFQITQNINPLAIGAHEYYFTEFFDTNTDSSESKNINRLVWTNGYRDTSALPAITGEVYSWTGGIALITTITATNLTIDASKTWRSLGFTEDASGNAYVIVNGLSYTLATPADLDTNSIDVTATTGASLGDFATSKIETDTTNFPIDVCHQDNGYVYHGSFIDPYLYQSNAFNRPSKVTLTEFQAVQNDIVLNTTSAYTGEVESTFHVVIDTVNPEINEQTFLSGGGGSLNDGIYDTSSYSGTAGDENVYSILMVGDYGIVASAITTGAFVVGENIVGSATGAEAVIVYYEALGAGAYYIGIKMLTSVGFDATLDTITGLSTGSTIVAASFSTILSQNFVQFIKNGAVVNIDTGVGLLPVASLITTTITLTDGLTAIFSRPEGHAVGDSFQLTINQGGADSFQWQKDNGTLSASTPITGAFQTLSDGVQIQFAVKTGHTIGDFWDVLGSPAVDRAWASFYYDITDRKPGEGYKYQLPSNFWAMNSQEDSVYVNTSNGEWSFITTQLSADLKSETVRLTPLKQAGASKVLYPYLTSHINDDLVYITVDKKLNTLGRKIYMEKPQTGYLSDSVKLDFDEASFIGGRIKYINKNLYISSPKEGFMFNFDTEEGYWNPPKMFPEVGILSIIGNDLICHSNTRNQSFTMFASNSDNGSGYEVIARTAFTDAGYRWNKKFTSNSFIEGYVTGSPPLQQSLISGIGGCAKVIIHDVEPIICKASGDAPLGEGYLGSHALASDLGITGDYFQEIDKRISPVLQWNLLALQISCTSKNHSYSILSMGVNGMFSSQNNSKLVNPSNLV